MEKQKGAWNTGYVKYDGNIYLFVNIGIPGRTGHDYANTWEDSDLIWYAKTDTHKNQPLIKEMINNTTNVFILTRTKNRAPFNYKGSATCIKFEDTVPIKITWRLTSNDIESKPEDIDPDLVWKMLKEAPNDITKEYITLLKRVRQGQNRLRNNLLYQYSNKCCVTGYGVTEVLKACHIEEHRIGGLNDSKNALLLRSDIHDLWDKNLIGFHPTTLAVHIKDELKETDYSFLDGQKIAPRKDGSRPDEQLLEKRWEAFNKVK
ncbi:HNH endonuclease signature motif containing protein [Chitinophaga niabensis]|uniref:HNH endonuclease n=1 Tax=Chitinophaga niabensis TaxID=536979 RepID=UPI0031BA1B47